MNTLLKVGDKAVYPGHGVGRIVSIENKDIMGSCLIFYSIEILETGIKIMFPENRLSTIGIRPVISKQEAEKVLDILKKPNPALHVQEKNWQKRHQAYRDKIQNGSIYEIVDVIRDLHSIKKDKELSYGEKRMMDKAQTMLCRELSVAMNKKQDICLPAQSV